MHHLLKQLIKVLKINFGIVYLIIQNIMNQIQNKLITFNYYQINYYFQVRNMYLKYKVI